MFYTLTASLPLLLNLVYFYNFNGGLNYSLITVLFILKEKDGVVGGLVIIILIIAFLVKLPIFFCSFMITKSSCRSSSSRVNNFSWGVIKIRGIWVMSGYTFSKH